MTVVTFLTWVSFFTGLGGLFVLAQPLLNPPWALVTSVYAHAGVGHLISNAVIVILAGSLVAWSTTRLRFHAFFVTTGALAGVAEVLISGLLGQPTAVLGASGAAFALVGYVLAANPASTVLFDRLNLPPRVLVVLVAAAGLVLTFLFSAPGSALIAHLTGAMLGLVAGRMRLLRVPKR
nr:rhomboid family intramembrane serine protease [Haladaptatus sp. QDMS2]